MTLELDPRQRAMLDEMGVKVWWPASVPADAEAEALVLASEPVMPAGSEATATRGRTAPLPPRASPSPLSSAPASSPAPASPRATPPATTAMVSAKAVPARGGAGAASPAPLQGNTVLIEAPQLLYDDTQGTDRTDTGNAQGGWLIVADMAPEPDGRHGAPFSGDAGRLLDNMLRALQLHRGEQPVHLMRTHRGSATATATDDATANATSPFADSFAARAVALAPRVILAMGPLAAQALFDSTEPLGKLRGRVAAPAALPDAVLIATYAPTYLLRNPADKARAWADLCLAAAKMDAARVPSSPV